MRRKILFALLYWIASSSQPWLTRLAGGLQAAALGRAIARHIEAHRLPPVTRIYCSPLLRCVQTAAAAAAALASASGIGIDARIDLSLMEHMGEAWYRSWCIGGVSDSTWGGPDGRKAWGTPVDEALIHPLAKRSASELLRQQPKAGSRQPAAGSREPARDVSVRDVS